MADAKYTIIYTSPDGNKQVEELQFPKAAHSAYLYEQVITWAAKQYGGLPSDYHATVQERQINVRNV